MSKGQLLIPIWLKIELQYTVVSNFLAILWCSIFAICKSCEAKQVILVMQSSFELFNKFHWEWSSPLTEMFCFFILGKFHEKWNFFIGGLQLLFFKCCAWHEQKHDGKMLGHVFLCSTKTTVVPCSLLAKTKQYNQTCIKQTHPGNAVICA